MRTLRLFTIVLTLSSTAVLPACRPPATIETEAGKKAHVANEVLIRVERLQNAAIAANKNGSLPTDQARAVVFVTVNLAEIAKATTEGWEATARQAWVQAKKDVPVLQPGGQFGLYVAAIDAVLGVL